MGVTLLTSKKSKSCLASQRRSTFPACYRSVTFCELFSCRWWQCSSSSPKNEARQQLHLDNYLLLIVMILITHLTKESPERKARNLGKKFPTLQDGRRTWGAGFCWTSETINEDACVPWSRSSSYHVRESEQRWCASLHRFFIHIKSLRIRI